MVHELQPTPEGKDSGAAKRPTSQHALAFPATSGGGAVQKWLAAAQPDLPSDEAGIDLRDLWRLVLKHRWMLVSMVIVGLLAAILLSFVRTPIYLAATTLQVDKRAAKVVKFGQQEDGAQDSDERTAMGTQLELLKSRVLAERVIDELRLDKQGLNSPAGIEPRDGGSLPKQALKDSEDRTGWSGLVFKIVDKVKDSYGKMSRASATSDEQLNREEVVDAFMRTIKVEQLRLSRVIRVSVENADPQLAARIANTMAQSFVALNLERRLESSSYAKTFLEQQLSLTKARLEESERKLQDYARARNILTLDEKTNVINQTFVEYSTALSKAEQDLIRIESEYEAIRSRPDTAKQVLESRTIEAYKAQRAKLDAEYQENSKVYKEDFPKMRQIRAQVEDLDAKITSEIQGILASVRNQLDTAKRQEELIRARLKETRKEIVAGQELGVDFNLYKREVDTNRELYNGLLQQVKEVGVAGGVETNNVQIVDKAQVPLFPYKPSVLINAVGGLVAGLVLGLGVILLMESFDDSIKFADEVEKVLSVPLLGIIPKVKSSGSSSANMALQAHEDPRGHMAEAYRSVRTALQFSTAEGAPRRLVITSTTKNEGKSTTSLALAINFAQLGSKVVLVDADMRNPTVHKFLMLGNTQGLSNYLSGNHPQGDLVRATDVPNLFVMTAGPIPPSPVDLLTGPKLGELMDLLQAQGAEYLIFDGPPVLGLADAIVLGNQISSVLYVVQASQTRKSHIKDAFRRLRMAGIVPRGVVLTKTTAQNTAYYTYESYYGYTADKEPSSKRSRGTEVVEPTMKQG